MSTTPIKAPVVSVLWRGTLLGICKVSIYLVDIRPDSILYEFHDIVPATLTPLELHNFLRISEAGEFIIDHQGSNVEQLVDLLIAQLEQSYLAGTVLAYKKDISDGHYRH